MSQQSVDVAVIGGGAAGLAAAIEAKKQGVNVVILERAAELGGILPQCIHTGFGLHYFSENLTGPEYIGRFIKQVRAMGIESKLETMVVKLVPPHSLIAINRVDGLIHVNAKAIVLAMGCRERPRGSLSIPGTRPAGVLTAGTAQHLMDIEGYMPGQHVIVLGSGDVGLIMARRLAMEGAHVEAVIEVMPYAGGLSRNIVQCLEDFQIPLLLQHTVTRIHGRERLEGVSIARVGPNREPIYSTECYMKGDTLILSVGLIPENELSRDGGILIDPNTEGPVIDENRETSLKGVFACGNVVHVNDLVDHVTTSGQIAGTQAAQHAVGTLSTPTWQSSLKAGRNIRYVVPHHIYGEKPARLYLRVTKPMRHVDIRVGDHVSFYRRVVTPPEIIGLTIPRGLMEREVEVLVEER